MSMVKPLKNFEIYDDLISTINNHNIELEYWGGNARITRINVDYEKKLIYIELHPSEYDKDYDVSLAFDTNGMITIYLSDETFTKVKITSYNEILVNKEYPIQTEDGIVLKYI